MSSSREWYMSRKVQKCAMDHKKENKIKNAERGRGGEKTLRGYEDTGLIPVPPARATDLNGWPCLDHSTTPFARNGSVQETQPDP